MALSFATKTLIENWLKGRCPALQCAACTGTVFEINEIVVCQPKSPTKGALAGRGPTLEYVPLVCGKCGFAMFFAVKTMGLTV